MTTHQPPSLLTIPAELRIKIWAQLAESHGDEVDNSGILNCCKQAAREMIPYIVPRDVSGEISDVIIRMRSDCVANHWLSLTFPPKPKPKPNLFTDFKKILEDIMDLQRYLEELADSFRYKVPRKQWHVDNMDNPIFDEFCNAPSVSRVQIMFIDPGFSLDENHIIHKAAQERVGFLHQFPKAMDVGRVLASIKTIDKLDICFKDPDYFSDQPSGVYWQTTPFASPFQSSFQDHGPCGNPLLVFELLLWALVCGEERLRLDHDIVRTRFGMLNFSGPEPTFCRWKGPKGWVRDGELERFSEIQEASGGVSSPRHNAVGVCPRTLQLPKLMDDYAALLGEMVEESVEIRDLVRHREATSNTSDRNFFHRLSRREPRPCSPPGSSAVKRRDGIFSAGG